MKTDRNSSEPKRPGGNDKQTPESTNPNRDGARPGPSEGYAEAIGGPTITDSGIGAIEAGYTPNELEERDANENYSSGNTADRSDSRSSSSSA